MGESKVDPGLLVRMQAQLEAMDHRLGKVERNPLVWLGWNMHYALMAVGVIFTGVATYFFKDKLGL